MSTATKPTVEQEHNYIKTGGVNCPFCTSQDINAGDREADGDTIIQDVACESCGKRWRDVFTLTRVMAA